jgi:thiol-disulfide isomerase/thioredoxin
MKFARLILLVAVVAGIGVSVYYLESTKSKIDTSGNQGIIATDSMTAPEKAKQYSYARDISTPDGFINTDPLTIEENIGKKIILVDFWTYSCINCQRTTPYLNAWHDKYADQGLLILGIHTPEFEFEKNYENVKDAVEKFEIKYPVILDNDFSTWRAYNNRYWPRKYLIDIDGYIVYDHIGEGGYAETEKEIQKLLIEKNQKLGTEMELDMTLSNVKAETPSRNLSPEVYFGSARNELLGNESPGQSGQVTLTQPKNILPNKLYLVGTWNITPEYAESASSDARIIFRYRAEKVFTVASASEGSALALVRNGLSLGDARGSDVSASGTVNVTKEDLYRLVEDPAGYGEHTLEITIPAEGVRFYTFTFG